MESIFRGFATWWSQIRQNYPPFWLAIQDGKNRERAGWSAVWYSSLTGWEKSAQFKLKMAVGKRLSTREADAWGCAPKSERGPLHRGLPSPREKQAREVGQEDLAESIGTRRCPRPRLGCHTLRSGGERGRGPGRYHLRRKSHPLTPHLRPGEAAGAGVGRVGEGEARTEQSGCSRRADSPFPTQEGCQAHCSWWDLEIWCRSWLSWWRWWCSVCRRSTAITPTWAPEHREREAGRSQCSTPQHGSRIAGEPWW